MRGFRRALFFCAAALALVQPAQGQFTYATNNGAITIIGYTGLSPVITLPSNIDGLTVAAIGDWAFAEFGTGLVSVTIPGSVTSIGQYAFSSDGLTNLTIPASVTNIEDYAFGWNPYLPGVVFQGNAPVADTTVFNNPVTVYYWTGTTGWSNTFAGNPAVATPPPAQFTYATTNGAITINGYSGPGGNMGIPPTINGMPVTAVGDWAFANNGSLTNVTIAGGVTNIGEGAFINCTGLTNVTIPYSVANIGVWAFLGDSSLQAINVDAQNSFYSSYEGVLFASPKDSLATLIQYPGGLVGDYIVPLIVGSIGDSAFEDCAGLTGVTITSTETNIGNSAFQGCSGLVSVTIADTVTSIGNNAFFYCTSLTNVTIPDSVTNLGTLVFANCASLTSAVLSTNLGAIPSEAFTACGALSNVAIPVSVTNIGDYSFSGCHNLTGVTIPGSMASIGDWAFGSCGLTNITIPGSVGSIGDSAFESCGSLTNVTLSNGVTVLGNYVFDDSGLISVTIPASVTSIGTDAFYDCFRLTNAAIGSGVTNIGQGAFAFCSRLTAITVASGNLFYSSLNGVLFDKSQSTLVAYPGGMGGNYAIPGNVTSIGEYAFYVCSNLTGVTIPASVTNIGLGAFEFCSGLTNAAIVNGVTSIGAQAFCYCPSLVDITIPASVMSLGESNFASCSSLASVFFPGNAPSADATVFYKDSNAIAYYLAGATGWSNTYAGIPAVQTSDPTQFTYTTNGGTITITGYVVSDGDFDIPAYINGMPVNIIASNAFKNFGFMTSVTIPGTVTNIAYEAFYGCSNLTSVIIPGSVTSIGRSAFSHCFSLTNVTISQGVPGIGYAAFYECSNLTSITIPGSVTNIAEYAFQYCTRLAGVYFAGKPPAVPSDAFNGDGSVRLYYLPGVGGWGSALAGYTPVPWNPMIQTGGGNFGMRTNHFGFNVTGMANIPIVVETCSDLGSGVWTALTNVTLTGGSFTFSEAAEAGGGGRYYRIRSP